MFENLKLQVRGDVEAARNETDRNISFHAEESDAGRFTVKIEKTEIVFRLDRGNHVQVSQPAGSSVPIHVRWFPAHGRCLFYTGNEFQGMELYDSAELSRFFLEDAFFSSP